jgi:hypothetical protein
MKRYKLHTLIDVTETNSRRGEDPRAYKQQQNWMTLIQTLGLRCNPIVTYTECENTSVGALGFGTVYTSNQQVWTVYFDFEHEDDDDLKFLVNDFDLVPVAADLDETVELEADIFRTKSKKYCNIVFSTDR